MTGFCSWWASLSLDTANISEWSDVGPTKLKMENSDHLVDSRMGSLLEVVPAKVLLTFVCSCLDVTRQLTSHWSRCLQLAKLGRWAQRMKIQGLKLLKLSTFGGQTFLAVRLNTYMHRLCLVLHFISKSWVLGAWFLHV